MGKLDGSAAMDVYILYNSQIEIPCSTTYLNLHVKLAQDQVMYFEEDGGGGQRKSQFNFPLNSM